MALRNTLTEWGSLAKWLHWLIAIGIAVLIVLGLEDMKAIHKSVALVVFALMTVRLTWRLMNETPTHPEGMPGWQRTAATLVHWGLYLVVTASAEVHKIKQTTAWLVFGILTGLMVLMGVGSQCAARKMSREMAPLTERMEEMGDEMEDMTPEEAGKAVGDFLKGLQESVGEE